jgi:hypothetical protein
MSLHAIEEAIFSLMHDDPYCDVLVDRMAPCDFLDSVVSEGISVAPLRDPIFNPTPDKSPLLIRLPRGSAWILLDQLAEIAYLEATTPGIHLRSVCAFLKSPLSLDLLAARLSRLLQLNVTEEGAMYFRYFDPRVTAQLPSILTAQQFIMWQRGISAWRYVDPLGNLSTLQDIDRKPPTDHESKKGYILNGLTLTRSQWMQVEAIEAINIAIQELQLKAREPHPHIVDQLKSAVNDAMHADLTEPRDRAVHALYAVLIGKEYHQHPDLAEVFALVKKHGIPLADVIEQKLSLQLPNQQ